MIIVIIEYERMNANAMNYSTRYKPIDNGVGKCSRSHLMITTTITIVG